MERALVYSRVSTDAQERDGTSLDTQERACLEQAAASGWHVVECIRDTASGYSLERHGIERVRQLLRQGLADVVVAYAVDRLSRNQNQIGVLFDEVERAGARLEFVTEKFEDTAIGRFLLSTRAFMAESEREKIAERTMRGKVERARSGRIPQGTGRGIYGYRYDRVTGRRELDPFQAEIVRRIFQRYVETQSFSSVSRELNDAGIPSYSGSRWYPLTIRRMLCNETYTGRMFFRRTRRTAARNGNNGTPRSRVVERPSSEWIEVKGSTPRIVDEPTWERVQQILQDPERTRRQPTPRYYPLRGRLSCGICGSAMVGQTLTVKGNPYRYYRCRHVYDKNTGRTCTARYVRGPHLEEAVWREVKRILSDPRIVMREVERLAADGVDVTEVTRVEQALDSLNERESRLVHVYTLGDISRDAVKREATDLSHERKYLEEQLRSLKKPLRQDISTLDMERIEEIGEAVCKWLERAGEPEKAMALEALQVNVEATSSSATLTGVVPADPPEFISDEQSSRCSSSGE